MTTLFGKTLGCFIEMIYVSEVSLTGNVQNSYSMPALAEQPISAKRFNILRTRLRGHAHTTIVNTRFFQETTGLVGFALCK